MCSVTMCSTATFSAAQLKRRGIVNARSTRRRIFLMRIRFIGHEHEIRQHAHRDQKIALASSPTGPTECVMIDGEKAPNSSIRPGINAGTLASMLAGGMALAYPAYLGLMFRSHDLILDAHGRP